MRYYYVYIMSNISRTLYTGVTNDLVRRVWEHRQKLVPGFTAKYHLTQLVYYEVMGDINLAIAREKQLKGWRRQRKIALIESMNPGWRDLAAVLSPVLDVRNGMAGAEGGNLSAHSRPRDCQRRDPSAPVDL